MRETIIVLVGTTNCESVRPAISMKARGSVVAPRPEMFPTVQLHARNILAAQYERKNHAHIHSPLRQSVQPATNPGLSNTTAVLWNFARNFSSYLQIQ